MTGTTLDTLRETEIINSPLAHGNFDEPFMKTYVNDPFAFISEGDTRIVLDIETLGTSPDSVIWQIAAIEIGGSQRTFNKLLRPIDQIAMGREVNDSTVKWTEINGDQVGLDTAYQLGMHHVDAIRQLQVWCGLVHGRKGGDLWVWCRGTDFDIAFMNNICKQLRMSVPWKYNAARDIRTLEGVVLAVCGVDGLATIREARYSDPDMVAHNALHDCEADVRLIVMSFALLQGRAEARALS